MALPEKITTGEKYGPAMEISDQAAAEAYFEQLVEHCMSFGKTREEAEKIERENLGYYAGYYDTRTREQVERFFHTQHPFFGSVEKNGVPSPETAFNIGAAIGSAMRGPKTDFPKVTP